MCFTDVHWQSSWDVVVAKHQFSLHLKHRRFIIYHVSFMITQNAQFKNVTHNSYRRYFDFDDWNKISPLPFALCILAPFGNLFPKIELYHSKIVILPDNHYVGVLKLLHINIISHKCMAILNSYFLLFVRKKLTLHYLLLDSLVHLVPWVCQDQITVLISHKLMFCCTREFRRSPNTNLV